MQARNGSPSGAEEIQREYRLIDSQWMRIHFRLLLFLSALAFAAELGMFNVLRTMAPWFGGVQEYWLKFVLIPTVGNGLLDLSALALMRSRLTDRQKIWGLSFVIALMALWVYTVHMIFAAMSMIFLIPALLTVAYGVRRITGVISLLCFVEKVFADLFLNGYSGRPSVLEDNAAAIDFIMAVFLLGLFYVLSWFITGIEWKKNRLGTQLEDQSMTDTLTRIGNRLAMRRAIQAVVADRGPEPCYLAMIDMDDFKGLNDTFGHGIGDEYLQALGQTILDLSTRRVEGFRYGGDEFCLLFRETEESDVLRICRELQEKYYRVGLHSDYRQVRISVGVGAYRHGDQTKEFLDRADRALYRAKQNKGSIVLGSWTFSGGTS